MDMTGQIRISPDTMRQRAAEYGVEAENLGAIISKMDSLLTALQEEWEGAASEAYAVKFQELRPGFVDAQNLINEISEALQKTATTLEETDANIGRAFS